MSLKDGLTEKKPFNATEHGPKPHSKNQRPSNEGYGGKKGKK